MRSSGAQHFLSLVFMGTFTVHCNWIQLLDIICNTIISMGLIATGVFTKSLSRPSNNFAIFHQRVTFSCSNPIFTCCQLLLCFTLRWLFVLVQIQDQMQLKIFFTSRQRLDIFSKSLLTLMTQCDTFICIWLKIFIKKTFPKHRWHVIVSPCLPMVTMNDCRIMGIMTQQVLCQFFFLSSHIYLSCSK